MKGKENNDLGRICLSFSVFQNKTQPGSTSPPSPSEDKAPAESHTAFLTTEDVLGWTFPTGISAAAEANGVKQGPLSPRGKESSAQQRAASNHYWRSGAELSSGLLPAKRLPLECLRSCKFV